MLWEVRRVMGENTGSSEEPEETIETRPDTNRSIELAGH